MNWDLEKQMPEAKKLRTSAQHIHKAYGTDTAKRRVVGKCVAQSKGIFGVIGSGRSEIFLSRDIFIGEVFSLIPE